jgi:hypothetical protein
LTTTTTPTTARAPVPHRAVTTLLTIGAPVAVTLATVALALSWNERLPEPIATSWDSNGPKGYASLSSTIVWLPLPGIGIAALAWAVGVFLGQIAITRRLAVATAVWSATFVNGLTIAMLAAQLDLADAVDAGPLGGSVVAVVAGSLVLAALAAVVIPGDPALPAMAPVPPEAPRLDLPDTEQATWVQRVEIVFPVVITVAVVVLATVIGAFGGMAWLGILLTAILCPVLFAMTGWTVTVDHRGLAARSRISWPRLVVPLVEIEHAEVATVDPLREFGGWGLRTGRGGRVGVVLRRGAAIEVHRTGGRVVVVTVDDAATAAALLNTLAARSRA